MGKSAFAWEGCTTSAIEPKYSFSMQRTSPPRFPAGNPGLRPPPMNYRFLVPLMTTAVLEQTVVTIVRVTTSYRAVELGLSVVWLGVITAAIAVLPLLLAVKVGPLHRPGATRHGPPWSGAGLLCISCGGFAVWPSLTGPLDLHRAARPRPPDAGHQPADPVRHRSDAGCARAQHRQLHGRERDRAGARPLYRRLCRRRRQHPADAVAVHGGVRRLVRDVRGRR